MTLNLRAEGLDCFSGVMVTIVVSAGVDCARRVGWPGVDSEGRTRRCNGPLFKGGGELADLKPVAEEGEVAGGDAAEEDLGRRGLLPLGEVLVAVAKKSVLFSFAGEVLRKGLVGQLRF